MHSEHQFGLHKILSSEATVKTNPMESDGPERPAKCSWTRVSYPIPSQLLRDDGGDFSDNPLDDTGLDLSAIPEDFDKAHRTLSQQGCMEERWRRYCKAKLREQRADDKWRDPKHALCEASDNDIHWFLGWCLKLQQEKDCCHLKGTKKASSFKSDWQSFRQYYKKVTKSKMHDEDSTNVWWGIKFLIMEHGLDMQKGRKVPVYIEDMVPFNETILSTQEKKFWLGFKQIQVCLYNTLGLFTIHQKNALLSLQYKDLQFSLQKDPKGGPPIPLVELTAEGVKKFMGSTDLITFPLPEVIYGPLLVFCPHTYLFGMMFHAKAFQHSGLTSMAQLRKLFVRQGCQQMPMCLKHETADWYIFCETELVKGTPVIQHKKPMPKQKMGRLLVVFSKIHGWLHPLFSHQFRYGGGKTLNESGWVSEEQRMLIMKHADHHTFVEHYHPQTVSTDMIRTICSLNPEKELMRAVARQD
uniref:Uncharacterized protein n=1 Tax=Coccidioides posadasii RMSCC 3488 TaxID=454284 RepID=A0A0J6HXI7_COCPO|nr:hypothetical protein CPAG_00011 [Coccidioides posadasii RMSCC 3488]